ncbi:MAG: ATP-binding protein [Lachnospiraceae bacterium]|nr:ATP-binding protein [Lachnospiraceae bacterium]
MKKKLILVAAPPASGKNAVTAKIAEGLGHAAVFDKDDLCPLVSRVFDATGNERDMDGAFYREHIRDAEYGTLFRLALSALTFEDCVIVNAPLGKEIRDTAFMTGLKADARERGAALYVVWLLSSPALCRERMAKRGAERDVKKLADFESYAKTVRYDPPLALAEANAVDRLILFGTASPEAFEKSLKNTLEILKEAGD